MGTHEDFARAFDEHWQQGEAKPDAEQRANGEWREPEEPTLDPAALHGLAGELVETIEPQSEADPVGILAHVLTFFGNAAGRGAHYLVEGSQHTTNLYVALVGRTSRGRKGTAAARARQPFTLADPDWADTRIANGLSSGEGLIWQVRDEVRKQQYDKKSKQSEEIVVEDGVADKRLCILEPEFGRVLQVLRRQGNTLSPVLRGAWEAGRLQSLTKNSPASATSALISIVAHITQEELLRYLDDTEIANGLVNRFVFLSVKRSKVLPHGGDDIDFGQLAPRLHAALEFARTADRLRMDDAARALWEEAYTGLTDDVPGLAGAITARAAPQVIRLALLYALLDRSYVIAELHLSAGLAFWRYSEASVDRIFGDAFGDPIADTILAALRQRVPDGMSRNEIRDLFSRNVESARIGTALDKLLHAGKATRDMITSGGRGRPTEMWLAS